MNHAEEAQGAFHVFSSRNDSLSPKGRRIFFVSMLAVSLTVATAWALQGAWYVLPFALIEMVVLSGALVIVERHADDCESISIDGDRVLVERRERGRVSRHCFDRHWVHVVVRESGKYGEYGLAMRSHGREVCFGAFLSDEQRRHLVAELRKRLRDY